FRSILFHGYATTHVDALCHVFWEGKMYNGKPASDVTSLGARSGDVSAWSTGITTRGVLLDIPKLRGADYVALGEPVRGYELLDAAKAQGVELRPGDAVCVYSGREKYYAANPDASPGVPPGPGLHPDGAPVVEDADAAMLSCDMMDATPNPYSIFQAPNIALPVHVLTIVQMGMPLLDNSLLEPLAEACAEEGRYEFMLTINP